MKVERIKQMSWHEIKLVMVYHWQILIPHLARKFVSLCCTNEQLWNLCWKKKLVWKKKFKKKLSTCLKPFTSKVLKQNHLNNNLQSTYRKCHSTEKVIVRVHHGIAVALENNSCKVLMFDLSAAFNVLDHGYLHKRMQYTFSITNNALTILEHFLSISLFWKAVQRGLSDIFLKDSENKTYSALHFLTEAACKKLDYGSLLL